MVEIRYRRLRRTPQSDTAGPGNVSLDGRGHDVVSALRGLDTRTDGRVLEFTAARPETRRKLGPFGHPFFIPLDLVVGDASVGPPDAATAVPRMLVASVRL